MAMKNLSKPIKTALRLTTIVLIAALLGVSVYRINAERVSGDVLPMPLGFGMTVVLSGSMEPTLSAGDLLIVVKADDYAVGDVVVYQSGRSGVVHRIVSVDGENVVTQGDANNIADAPISRDRIKGKVACAIPAVGHVVNWIKTPIVSILLLAAAVFLTELSFRRDKRRDEAEKRALKEEIEKLKSGNK